MNSSTGDASAVHHYAAVDLGATSGRVVVGSIGASTATFDEVHRFTHEPLGVGAELRWDATCLFEQTVTGLRAAVDWCRRRGSILSGIGVDSWGVDFALLDSDGTPGPIGHYRAEFDYSAALAARPLTPTAAFELSGVPDQYINSAHRLRAAAQSAAAETRMLFVPDLWIYLLTGALGTEPSIASTSQLLSVRERAWSRELVAASAVTSLSLPEVRPAGSVAGMTSPEMTTRIGADQPVPVIRVLEHDTASAFAFAEPAAGVDVTGLISSGTWSVVGLCVDEPVTSPDALREGFTNELGLDSVLFIRNLTGMWVLEQCMREWRIAGNDLPPISELVARAAEVEVPSGAVFDLSDPVLAAPGDMTARVVTLSNAAGRPVDGREPAQIARVIFDSLAAAYAEALRTATRLTSTQLRDVHIVGGGARNVLLCQLTTDLLDVPVTAGPFEASSVGNVAMQAVALGQRGHPKQAYPAAPLSTVTYRPGNRSRRDVSTR